LIDVVPENVAPGERFGIVNEANFALGKTRTGGNLTAAMKSAPEPQMTLGNAAAARVRLIVWCKACGHRVEPDAAEMAER
jgi:dipeptidase